MTPMSTMVADGDGDTGQCNNVGINAEELHADEGKQYSQRQNA